MISCQRATELTEKQPLFGLSGWEKFQLNLHTSMCKICRQYQNASSIIDKAMNRSLNQLNEDFKFPEKSKKEILIKLSKKE